MVRFLFWLLLLGNGAVFAYHQAYLTEFFPKQHEPLRLKQELNADKIRLIGAQSLTPMPTLPVSAVSADTTPGQTPGQTVPSLSAARLAMAACMEMGEFALTEAKRFESELLPLALGQRQSRRNVPQISAYVVQIPQQGSKEGADKKANQLRNMKVNDFYVINDPNSPVRWSISLGVYTTKAAAQSQLALLNIKGVQTAEITTRTGGTNKLVYQWRDLTPEQLTKLEAIALKYPEQERKACKG
jgi:hypothetical protein